MIWIQFNIKIWLHQYGVVKKSTFKAPISLSRKDWGGIYGTDL